MLFILKALVLALALLFVGACALGARIALTTRDYFIVLCCGGGAAGMLALVIHYIF